MSTTGTAGDGYAAVRGVAALAVMLAAARMPDRLARPGAALAARIAPPEEPEDVVVQLPAQRSRSTPARSAAGRPLSV